MSRADDDYFHSLKEERELEEYFNQLEMYRQRYIEVEREYQLNLQMHVEEQMENERRYYESLEGKIKNDLPPHDLLMPETEFK